MKGGQGEEQPLTGGHWGGCRSDNPLCGPLHPMEAGETELPLSRTDSWLMEKDVSAQGRKSEYSFSYPLKPDVKIFKRNC